LPVFLRMSEKSSTFAAKMTYYDYIRTQVEAGLWTQTQAVFGRNAQALDLYYRIYNLVLKYEPQKTYGYASRIAANESIYSQIGGDIRIR